MQRHALPDAWPPSPLPPLCCGGSCNAMPGGLAVEGFYESGDGPRIDASYPWVQLELAHHGSNEVIAAARGQWDCEGPVQSFEARWRVVSGAPGRDADRGLPLVISRISAVARAERPSRSERVTSP